jgi:hypothetical protein
MSAKHSKKKANKPGPAPAPAAPAAGPAAEPALAAAVPAGAGVSGAAAAEATAWIDSSDPRRRAIGKAVLVAVWVYVAALWLLALDQWFNWGIFGPKVPPIP